jgi:hypothetical protein
MLRTHSLSSASRILLVRTFDSVDAAIETKDMLLLGFKEYG